MEDAFPRTDLRILYDALSSLKQQEPTAIAEWHARDPEKLLYRLEKDAKTVAAYPRLEEAFNDPETRKPLPGRPIPVEEIKRTEHFVSHLADRQWRSVEGEDGLRFRYVDREIFPLRQTGDLGRPEKRKLDLLLVAEDGLPIVGEVKVGPDEPTYFAFVQALMYAVELSSPDQRARLAEHNRDAEFQWPAEGPFVDIFLIAFDPPPMRDNNNRQRSYEATKEISRKMVKDSRCSSLIRRIAYIEAERAEDGLVFKQHFVYGA